jgi:hypothetical protein
MDFAFVMDDGGVGETFHVSLAVKIILRINKALYYLM